MIRKQSVFRNVCFYLSILFLLSACAKRLQENKAIATLFTSHHKQGAFALYDIQKNGFEGHNFAMYKDSIFSCFPASFPLIALIGIETGVINTEQIPLITEGTSVNLVSAMANKDSVFFKDVVQKIDSARLQFFLDSIPFGVYEKRVGVRQRLLTTRLNMDILLGFIKKVYAQNLPFQGRTYDILTKAMSVTSSTLGGEVHYFNLSDVQRNILLGWVEVRKRPYFFVLQTKEQTDQKTTSSVTLLMAILEELHLLAR